MLEKNGIKINEQSSFNISYGKYMLVEIIKDDRTPNERKVYDYSPSKSGLKCQLIQALINTSLYGTSEHQEERQ